MENEKSIIKIEKIVLILIIMCIFGVLSGRIYEFVGQEITNSCFYVLIILSFVLAFVLVVKYLKGIFNSSYSRKSKKVWGKIKEKAEKKVLLYLKNNRKHMEVSEVVLFMDIYSENPLIFSRLLNEVERLYKSSDYYIKSVLSLVLLKNEDHNEVTKLFKSNLKLETNCKDISKENVRTIKKDFECLQKEVNDKKLLIFFQKLSHICLPQNSISDEELFEFLNFILGWAIQNVSKENINSYQESMSVFILLIPVMKNRLNKLKKYNMNIDDSIEICFNQIEHSKWFKYLIDMAYKNVYVSLCSNDTSFIKNEQWISYLCIISLYNEKLFFWKKLKLLGKINNKQQKLYKEYDVEKVVLFVLGSSSIREVKSSDDLLYNGLSLVYLCMSPLIKGL